MDFAAPKPATELSVLIWGAEGTGKTPNVLHLARHAGPAAAIDADGGLVTYLDGTEDWIKVIESEDPIYVRTQLELLAANPGEFRLCAIDPLSTIYTNLVHQVGENERVKASGSVGEFDNPLTIRSWGPIKDRNRDLMRVIRWMGKKGGMPVIATAREDNEWVNNRVAGVRPAGDKSLGYEFTLNIRLSQSVPGGPRIATLVRDRLRRFPDWLEGAPDDPCFLARKILELYPERFGHKVEPHERAGAEVIDEILQLVNELRLPHKKVVARIRELGFDSIEDLSPEAAGTVLDGLRGLYQERKTQTTTN